MEVFTEDHPGANGRVPKDQEIAWVIQLPLADKSTLIVRMGKKSRDLLFGMLIADYSDNNEVEPNVS